MRQLDHNDLTTILVALRLFQREYEGVDAKAIAEEWDHFNDAERGLISPLGTEDIDDLCEELNTSDLFSDECQYAAEEKEGT